MQHNSSIHNTWPCVRKKDLRHVTCSHLGTWRITYIYHNTLVLYYRLFITVNAYWAYLGHYYKSGIFITTNDILGSLRMLTVTWSYIWHKDTYWQVLQQLQDGLKVMLHAGCVWSLQFAGDIMQWLRCAETHHLVSAPWDTSPWFMIGNTRCHMNCRRRILLGT